MRFRSVLVVVSLCLGTSAGILGQFDDFLKVLWSNLGTDIDPLGHSSPVSPTGDDPGHIDPWG